MYTAGRSRYALRRLNTTKKLKLHNIDYWEVLKLQVIIFQHQQAAATLLIVISATWIVCRINSMCGQKVIDPGRLFKVIDMPYRQLPTRQNRVKIQRCRGQRGKLKWVNAETLNRTGRSVLPVHVSFSC